MEEEIIISYITNEEAEKIIEEQISLGRLFVRHDTIHSKITFRKTDYFPIIIQDEVD